MNELFQRTRPFLPFLDYAGIMRPSSLPGKRYLSYTLQNFRELPQIAALSKEQIFEMEVVGHILPFKVNNYVTESLIDWDNIPHDPVFVLTFPQRGMLKPRHFKRMASALRNGSSKEKIRRVVEEIRGELNPHPAGQVEHNIPSLGDMKLPGMQHKYRETVLFFPSQGQTCHAYCSFCFRWAQFVGMHAIKFATRETALLVRYVRRHPEVTDILITGGDPLFMSAKVFALYINSLLNAHIPHLRTIRIGTKALGFWPHRFVTDPDANDLLELFSKITKAGKHLALMAHINHPKELSTDVARKAISRIQDTGAQIRTQSPLLGHINDKPEILAELWREQVQLGCIPYYLFVARDTGSQHFFGISLVKTWKIFRKAYEKVTGLARTVRGPSMSTAAGKVQVLGLGEVHGEKVFVLRFLQARKQNWVQRPFFAQFDPRATWLSELRPAFGEARFFFEKEPAQGDNRGTVLQEPFHAL